MTGARRAVVAGLSGGLGNQLFQYAAGRALALRLGTSLSFDVSWFSGRSERQFGLEAFSVAGRIIRPLPLPAGLVRLESRTARRWATRRNGVRVFRERQFNFDGAFDRLEEPVFLEGFWQSERYFSAHQSMIRADLTLDCPMSAEGRQYQARIAETDAICVHVRRGDYVSSPAAALTHGSCSPGYYRAGVAAVARSLARPHCFVFSDEPDWVRENLRLDFPTTVIDAHSAGQPHLDLALMSSCNHFVIANSSLSWWGAWLGQQPNKQVIAPSPWFRDPRKDTRDLLPPGWRTLGGNQL